MDKGLSKARRTDFNKHIELKAEEMNEADEHGDYFRVWKLAYQVAARGFGNKRRRFDVASLSVPSWQEWQKHLQQEGCDGGWKGVMLTQSSPPLDNFNPVQRIKQWPSDTSDLLAMRDSISTT